MELLIAIALSFLGAVVLRKQIRRHPTSFYIAAVVVDALFLSRSLFGVSRELAVVVYPYAARCLIGFSLFTLVMFIGVLPKASKTYQMLVPVRGEISIIAAILTLGHVVNYLETYLGQMLSGFIGMSAGMVASFAISSLLLVLLAALTITSFDTIKACMPKQVWKTLQKTAYIFFGLTYLHILLVLAPTISSSGQRAFLSIIIYTAVVTIYAALRVARYLKDRRFGAQGVQGADGADGEDGRVMPYGGGR